MSKPPNQKLKLLYQTRILISQTDEDKVSFAWEIE